MCGDEEKFVSKYLHSIENDQITMLLEKHKQTVGGQDVFIFELSLFNTTTTINISLCIFNDFNFRFINFLKESILISLIFFVSFNRYVYKVFNKDTFCSTFAWIFKWIFLLLSLVYFCKKAIFMIFMHGQFWGWEKLNNMSMMWVWEFVPVKAQGNLVLNIKAFFP